MLTSELVYSSDHGLMIGFHGCDESVRNKVVLNLDMLRSSNNNWDWLGDGMYFWQNNYERALDFATHPPPNVKISNPAVLGAVFSLGNCLDLADKKYLDLVKMSYDILEASAKSGGNNLPVNRTPDSFPNSKDKIIRELDCAVIRQLHTLQHQADEPPFDSVRALFIEGDELYKNAGFYQKTHIQIAIRNPNCIKGFFIPRKKVGWPKNSK